MSVLADFWLAGVQAQVEAFARKNKHYGLREAVAVPVTPGKVTPYVPPIIFEDDDDDERDVHIMLCIVLPDNAEAFHVQVRPRHLLVHCLSIIASHLG